MKNKTSRNSTITVGAALLVCVAIFVFATSAVAQTPAVQGCVTLADGGQFCPTQQASAPAPAPTPTATASDPLDKRAEQVVNEFVGAGNALAKVPHAAAGSPAPAFTPTPDGSLPWILVGLLLVAALVWALTRNRRQQNPPPAGNGRVEGDFLVVRHPLEVNADPLRLHATVNVAGAVAPPPAPPAPPVAPAPVVPPAPPVAPPPVAPPVAPAPPAPPAPAPPRHRAARRARGAAAVAPAVLVGLLLLGAAVRPAMAQNVIQYHVRVNGLEGLYTPSAPAAIPAGLPANAQPTAINGRQGFYIPPTANGPSAIVPTAPPAPAAPAAPRRAARQAPAPAPSAPALDEDRLAAKIASAIKAVIPAPTPAAAVPAPAPATPVAAAPTASVNLKPIVDRLNDLTDRVVKDEADIKNIGNYANGVGDLALKTAAADLPKMSTRGGQKSPACQVYLAGQQLPGGLQGNPPKGCQQ